MKATILMAVLAIAFVSCKKGSFTVPDVTPQASMQAKISPVINQPREAMLGDSNAIFAVGERMTIYVPYNANNDGLEKATLMITDEAGAVITSVDMTRSTNIMTGGMNVPRHLQGSTFVFATIDLGEACAGKWLTLHTQVSGGHTVSDDKLVNAFFVQN